MATEILGWPLWAWALVLGIILLGNLLNPRRDASMLDAALIGIAAYLITFAVVHVA